MNAIKQRRAAIDRTWKSAFALALAAACGLEHGQAAAAESAAAYPSKPIRLIIANTTGTSVDTLARVLGVRIGEELGQQVVADNRGGAGGRPRAVNRVPACGMRTSASRDARR